MNKTGTEIVVCILLKKLAEFKTWLDSATPQRRTTFPDGLSDTFTGRRFPKQLVQRVLDVIGDAAGMQQQQQPMTWIQSCVPALIISSTS
jgi:hypothetical protein